jgi:hypothetical protein
MKNLKLSFQRSYRKASKIAGARPRLTFVYAVSGPKESLDHYAATQGEFYRESDNGEPLYFTQRFAGESCELVVKQDESAWFPDTSALDIQVALAEQYGGNFGQSLADRLASKLVTKSQTPTARPATGTKSSSKKKPGDL